MGEGYYVATVPALRGCHTQARSVEALKERVREAIELCLEAEGGPGGVIVAMREALMAQSMLERDQLKVLMKEALVEVLEENRDLMRTLLEEILGEIALARAMQEEAEDLAAIEERQHEPNLAFEDVLSDLRSRGKL